MQKPLPPGRPLTDSEGSSTPNVRDKGRAGRHHFPVTSSGFLRYVVDVESANKVHVFLRFREMPSLFDTP